MFGLGPSELLIVGIVAVLLFGRKLPDVARSLGSSYREFRKGLNEFQTTVNADTYTKPKPYLSNSARTDNYSSYTDYTDTPTAPKFEPPASEPQVTSDTTAAPSVASDAPVSAEPTATQPAPPSQNSYL